MRMYLLTIQFVVVAILLILPRVCSFRWLGINSTLVNESKEKDLRRYLCSSSTKASKNRLLDKEQKKICRKKTKMMKYVVAAAELAKRECLRLTKYERWDCTGILKAPKFSRDLRVGTKQASFIHALSSAALVYTVTQNCATDKVCECGNRPSRSLLRRLVRKNPGKSYRYDGCHDNIVLGIKFSKDFLDRHETTKHTKPERTLVNLHNNDLGRKVVENNMNVTCNCKGFEGFNCYVEECLNRLIVPFSKIAVNIFSQYKQSQLVVVGKSKTKGRKKKAIRLIVKNNGNNKKRRKPDPNKMVYLYKSRDFCLPDVNDPSRGRGVKGRVCAQRLRNNKQSRLHEYNPNMPVRLNVCAYLCCGRGHTTTTFIKKMNCGCRFSYSRMSLVCRKCSVVAETSKCK